MHLLSFIFTILPLFAPHTWNAEDAIDDTPGYLRGEQTYEVSFPLQVSPDSAYLICFDGVNQEAWVSLNGSPLGYHAGGYTRFYFDATDKVWNGNNLLSVRVSNAYNPDIPPLSADFTFFGGIYRPAYLTILPKHHILPDGITICTSDVSEKRAVVEVRTQTSFPEDAKCRWRYSVVSPAGDTLRLKKSRFTLQQPMLWSPDTPHLYTMVVQLCDRRGRVMDEASTRFGLRYYHFDAQTGFYLNGKPLKLIGTNRHQDESGYGNALEDWQHERDIRLLKEMGGNFLRVSHYPQARRVMDMCDSLGILCSVEIPLVNAITESQDFEDNSMRMLDEMIQQNRNHPCVIVWAYMNEILLRPPFKHDPSRDSLYRQHATELAQRLNSRCKALDPERYTMIAFHDNMKLYNGCAMTAVPDIIGMNIYQGWYSGNFSGLETSLEAQHAATPEKVLLISEYGADCDTRIRSAKPVRFDYSIDHALRFHRHYLHVIQSTPYIAAGAVWNLNDFQSEGRAGAIPHFNLKGLTTTHREPKATYYYYQSMLHPDAAMRAHAKEQMDSLLRMPVATEYPICVLLGTDRWFTENTTGQIWQSEQAYQKGSHGYIGGHRFSVKTNHGRLPAADADIMNTHNDPIFQTARLGISEYRLDVPDGAYELTLYFAELQQQGEVTMSVYNLGSKVLDTGFEGRKMTVCVNGQEICHDWQPEWNTACEKTICIRTHHDEGIRITLNASQGETILNAIKLTKLEEQQ